MKTPFEQEMREMGQQELSQLMCELRLLNPYPSDLPEHLLWNEQAQINIPLLIQASLALNAFCKQYAKKRILFTARDCCLWIRLFKILYPNYESIYFHVSRFVCYAPSESFLEYVQHVYSNDAVIVDLHGPGKSVEKFFQKHFQLKPNYFSIFACADPFLNIERINYDVVGALYDFQKEPLRAPLEYDLRYVVPSHACIQKCEELLPAFQVTEFNQQVIGWAALKFRQELQVGKFLDLPPIHVHACQDGTWRHSHVAATGCQLDALLKRLL